MKISLLDTQDEILTKILMVKGEKGDKGDNGAITNLDTELSTTSTNPVQNKAITLGIQGAIGKTATNSFTDGIVSYFKNVSGTIVPIQAGSGTPSPTNVRAISGYTNLIPSVCGKNFFNKNTVTRGKYLTNVNQTIDTAVGCYSDYIPIRLNTPYYYTNFIGLSEYYTLNVYDGNKNFIENISVNGSTSVNGTITFTRGAYIRVNVYIPNLDTCQLELGTSATTYEAYNGNTITIPIGQTAYSGTFAISGKKCNIVLDKFALSIDSSSDWFNFAYGSVNATARVSLPYNAKVGESIFTTSGTISSTGQENPKYWATGGRVDEVTNYGNNSFAMDVNYVRFYLTGNIPTTLEEFKAAFVATTILYPLETPITISLDISDFKALQGTNNLTANTGSVTEVEYITNDVIAWILDLIEG